MKKIAVLVLLLLCSWWAHGQILTDSNLPIVVIETDNGVTIPDEPRVYYMASGRIAELSDGCQQS